MLKSRSIRVYISLPPPHGGVPTAVFTVFPRSQNKTSHYSSHFSAAVFEKKCNFFENVPNRVRFDHRRMIDLPFSEGAANLEKIVGSNALR